MTAFYSRDEFLTIHCGSAADKDGPGARAPRTAARSPAGPARGPASPAARRRLPLRAAAGSGGRPPSAQRPQPPGRGALRAPGAGIGWRPRRVRPAGLRARRGRRRLRGAAGGAGGRPGWRGPRSRPPPRLLRAEPGGGGWGWGWGCCRCAAPRGEGRDGRGGKEGSEGKAEQAGGVPRQ